MKAFRRVRKRAAAFALPFAAATVTTGIALAATIDARPDTTLRASDDKTRIGKPVRLSGNGQLPDVPVRISFNPAGRERSWRIVERLRTGREGGYSTSVSPRRTGAYRARAQGTDFSRHVPLRLRSKTRGRVDRRGVVGRGVRIGGRVRPGNRGRRVAVIVGGETLRTATSRGGRFRVRWEPPDTGRYIVRIRAHGDIHAAGSRDRAGRITVFRPAHASWYGPGFYGNRTACGQTLAPSTLGVAHKSMPCGTRLTLRYKGRQVAVEVIDRGPYVAGREFDLTEETKERLGFGSTGTVLSSK